MNIVKDETETEPGRPSLHWDVNTAFAAYIVGALVFLVLVRRGFRGFTAK